jgi:rubrerythrin
LNNIRDEIGDIMKYAHISKDYKMKKEDSIADTYKKLAMEEHSHAEILIKLLKADLENKVDNDQSPNYNNLVGVILEMFDSDLKSAEETIKNI